MKLALTASWISASGVTDVPGCGVGATTVDRPSTFSSNRCPKLATTRANESTIRNDRNLMPAARKIEPAVGGMTARILSTVERSRSPALAVPVIGCGLVAAVTSGKSATLATEGTTMARWQLRQSELD